MKRFESKNVAKIKAAAEQRIGRKLNAHEDLYGLALPDDRPPAQRFKRSPVPAAGPSAMDKVREKLAAEKREAKIQRLPQNERLLAIMDDIAGREAPTPDVEDVRYEQALAIRDSIRFGNRNAAALQLADEVLEQFGGDAEELDRRWNELLKQESEHIGGLRAAKLQKQQELLAELASLGSEAAAIPTAANRWGQLQYALQSGMGLPVGGHDEIEAATTPEAQAVVLAKVAPQLSAWEAQQEAQ